jgi:pyruvate dehydrogenase E1 component alpha subunit
MNKMNSNQAISLYKSLVYLRRAEEVIADEYRTGSMRTPTHFGIGQEAVAVGVCSALEKGDVVYTHHRSHTHYLAKGGSLFGLIAELLGRVDGCSKGRGGSVHIVDTSVNFMGSSPILGHSLALATGSALAFKMDNLRKVAVAFFGEGACDEGAVWESFNYASVNNLPVIFVCENNLYATESPLSVRQAVGADLCERASSFQILSKRVDGNDVAAVNSATMEAVKFTRNGGGPVFLECMTYRWREHVGPLWDYEANRTYRTKEELEKWMLSCPIKMAGIELIKNGIASESDLREWQDAIDVEIFLALARAKDSAWPSANQLFENI